MTTSTVLPLILTVVTLIGVLMSPALQGAGALTLPQKRVLRSLINSVLKWVLKEIVRLFGAKTATPPAEVVRAFHRGEDLIVLSDDNDRWRVAWSA